MMYRQGSVTVVNGSSEVTGVNTDFVAACQPGYLFYAPDLRFYEIAQIVSATKIVVFPPYQSASAGGQSYGIFATTAPLADIANDLAALLRTFAAVRDGAGQGLFQAGSKVAPGIRGVNDQDTGIRWVSDNVLAIVVGGSDKLFATSAGIGIRTDVPGRSFDFRGGNDSQGNQVFGRIASLNKQRFVEFGQKDSGSASRIYLQGYYGDANAETSQTAYDLLLNPEGGLIGIGTNTPMQKLHIYGGGIFNQTAAGAAYFYGGNADGVAGKRYSYMSLASGTVAWGRVSDDLSTVTEYGRFDQSGNFIPGSDNTLSLGTGGMRFSVVYAGSGSINTSDARAKQQIGDVPDAWLDAWGDVEWVRYKFNDAVQAKGDEARWHFGLIAQQVRDAFAAHGLDALTLGLLCHDEWAAIPAIPAVEEERDEAGEIITPASPAQPGHEAGERWGLRYDECQAIEAAYQRRRIARLEAQIAQLSAQHG